jgi:hypothetical protein
MTVAPAWGISAAPSRPGPYGRGGPWEDEVRDLEAAYGPERTLHVSLEEFARTWSLARESRERFREGGVPSRALGERRRAETAADRALFREAFRNFRAFDRPNVLHLYATLHPDPAFRREFPAAVQVGPLWPGSAVRPSRRTIARREWVWYASPASAEAIADPVVAALADQQPPVHLFVRSPRPWRTHGSDPRVAVRVDPLPATRWRRRFRSAELRIVTGSRTLLEAMEVGGPFLYFNGVLGAGAARRRHRPEKIDALLDWADRSGVPEDLRRDLADFARGRRVAAIVARAAGAEDGWARFPKRFPLRGFPPGLEDAGAVIVRLARALARTPDGALALVASVRRASNA